MSFTLPDLPYAYNALEPHIDERTMEIHHDKHHAAYVAKLNAALEGHADLEGRSIEDLLADLDQLPEGIRTAVRNNGGGHYNHSLFWKVMSGSGGGTPSGDLGAAIDSDLGGFDAFKEAFAKAGATRFGSGWAWLSVEKAAKSGRDVVARPVTEGEIKNLCHAVIMLNLSKATQRRELQKEHANELAAAAEWRPRP